MWWLFATVWRMMFPMRSFPMIIATIDKTPVLFERRCEAGHFHIFVVPRYLIPHLQVYYPDCDVRAIDRELIPEATAIVEAGLQE